MEAFGPPADPQVLLLALSARSDRPSACAIVPCRRLRASTASDEIGRPDAQRSQSLCGNRQPVSQG